MSDGMGRELAYLSSHATNRYFIPNWGIYACYIKTETSVRLNYISIIVRLYSDK